MKTIKKYAYNNKDEGVEEITGLEKKVNPDNLIYRYKGFTTDVKFDEFDNALNLSNKIREGGISLVKAKNDQIRLKSNTGEIKKRTKKIYKKNKKTHCTILKSFTKQETMLLIFFMIILQCYLKQNMKQLKESELTN